MKTAHNARHRLDVAESYIKIILIEQQVPSQ